MANFHKYNFWILGAIDGDFQRQGRFCGPHGGDSFPHDGTGNHVSMNGKMNFFSQPFDIRNNQAFVGFDADQSFIGGGFTLQWNAKRMYEYDFTDVFEAHQFVTEEAAYLFTKVQFNTERGKFQTFFPKAFSEITFEWTILTFEL